MDKAIVDFLSANYVLSLSIAENNKSWSVNCFYAFNPDDDSLIFISHGNTKHYQMLLKNPYVSGTIVAQTQNFTHIQGIQYTGKTTAPSGTTVKLANTLYNQRFPFARFVLAKLWVLELHYVKYTDNTLGFGKKITWERSDK